MGELKQCTHTHAFERTPQLHNTTHHATTHECTHLLAVLFGDGLKEDNGGDAAVLGNGEHLVELCVRAEDGGDLGILEDKLGRLRTKGVVEWDARAALAPQRKERLDPGSRVDTKDTNCLAFAKAELGKARANAGNLAADSLVGLKLVWPSRAVCLDDAVAEHGPARVLLCGAVKHLPARVNIGLLLERNFDKALGEVAVAHNGA